MINYIYSINALYGILLLLVYLFARRRKYFKQNEPFYGCFLLGLLAIVLEVISTLVIVNRASLNSWILQISLTLFSMVENFFVVLLFDHHLSQNKVKNGGSIINGCSALVILIAVLSFFFQFEFTEGNSMFIGKSIAFDVGYVMTIIIGIAIIVIAVLHRNDKDKRTTFINIMVGSLLSLCSLAELLFGHFINAGGIAVLCIYSILFEFIGYSNELGDIDADRFELPILNAANFKEDFEKEANEFTNNKQRFYLIAYCFIDNYKGLTNNQGYNVGNNAQLLCSKAIGIECKSASSVYQIEDDKYVILYKDIVEDVCKNELLNVYYTFSNLSEANELSATITIGYAKSSPNYSSLSEILNSASFITRHNQEKKLQLNSNEKIVYETEFNLTGLSEKIFESMCLDNDEILPYIINLKTNLCRVSSRWKELFGLDEEVVFDFSSVWIPHILKEDQRKFIKEYNELINSDASSGVVKFKAYDAKGIAVSCEIFAKIYEDNDCKMISGYMRTNIK